MLLFMIALVGSLAVDCFIGLIAVGLVAWTCHFASGMLREQWARRRQVRNRQRQRTEFWGYE